MTPEQQAAFVVSQATCAQVQIAAMQAENARRQALGYSIAYDEEAFLAVIEKYGIHHNAVLSLFQK